MSAKKLNSFLSTTREWEWAKGFPSGHFGCSYSASKFCITKYNQMDKDNCDSWLLFQGVVLDTDNLLL